MRYLLILCILSFVGLVKAQTIQISGRVTDATTGRGIPFTSLNWLSQPGGAVADEDGGFTLDAEQLPRILIVSSLGYQADTLHIALPDYLEIQLVATGEALPEVSVTADQVWEVINKEKVFPLDFAVCQNRLFVLGQRGIGNRFHLSAYSAAGEMQFERELTIGKITGLESNCFDQLVLKTRDYAIRIDVDQFEPIEKTPIKDYEKLFTDCRASSPDHIYLERKEFAGFRKRYFVGERKGSEIDVFKDIWYRKKARLTAAFLRQRVPTIITDGHDIVFEYDFNKAVTFKNHNDNTLFLDGESVVLFNFDHDAIEHYSLAGESLSTVEIGFNKDEKPDDALMVHDPITGKYYAIRRAKGGYALHEINLTTGNVIRELPLNIARYNKLAVLDDRVYMVGVALRGRVSEHPRFMRLGL